MLQRSVVSSEVACTNEDDGKIVLDPNDIRKALEEFDVDMDSIKALVNKRRDMYERLSKL